MTEFRSKGRGSRRRIYPVSPYSGDITRRKHFERYTTSTLEEHLGTFLVRRKLLSGTSESPYSGFIRDIKDINVVEKIIKERKK